MTPLNMLRISSSNASVLHTYLTVEFIDLESEVEIDNLDLPPTQDSDVEII